MGKADFKLVFEERPGYLYAFISGPEDSLEVGFEAWEQVKSKVTELGAQRLMVEEDFPNQLSSEEMFQTGEYVAELFKDIVKLAHVDRDIAHVDLNRLGAAVALSNSVLARVFDNVEDAEKWLLA